MQRNLLYSTKYIQRDFVLEKVIERLSEEIKVGTNGKLLRCSHRDSLQVLIASNIAVVKGIKDCIRMVFVHSLDVTLITLIHIFKDTLQKDTMFELNNGGGYCAPIHLYERADKLSSAIDESKQVKWLIFF